jgi:hypothetical protein
VVFILLTWGLRPRLYAAARYRGLNAWRNCFARYRGLQTSAKMPDDS